MNASSSGLKVARWPQTDGIGRDCASAMRLASYAMSTGSKYWSVSEFRMNRTYSRPPPEGKQDGVMDSRSRPRLNGVRKRRGAATRRTSAVSVCRPHAAVWRHALVLAEGDHRRLEVQPDATVVVRNHPVR